MKFIFITDTHLGGKNLSGFQMQPRYTEHNAELLTALDKVVRREAAELVIHGGDMTDDGTPEQIHEAAFLYRKHLSAPVVLALGNHDCRPKECAKVWLEYGAGFFPAGTCDTTIICDGLRIDVLSLHWGKEEQTWTQEDGQFIHLAPEQWERLRNGDQTLPRIIVMHAQIRPGVPEKTGLDHPVLVPENNFAATGDALIAEFHPLMILSGHNHLNLRDDINGTFAVSASSLAETPFECKLVEYRNGKLSMETLSLADELDFKGEYWEHQRFVQGLPEERCFSTAVKSSR